MAPEEGKKSESKTRGRHNFRPKEHRRGPRGRGGHDPQEKPRWGRKKEHGNGRQKESKRPSHTLEAWTVGKKFQAMRLYPGSLLV